MIRFTHWFTLSLISLLFLQACQNSGPDGVPATLAPAEPTDLPRLPDETVPPLQPTFTPSDPNIQPATQTPNRPVLGSDATTAPAVDLNEPVLRLVYQIPAIGLDRTLEANLAGKLTLTDVAKGNVVTIPNGQRFLTEITSAIQTNAEFFEPVPADCDTCVIIGFDLPAAGSSARGTLADPILQVSIQHLFASRLGPHFPPDTLIGHHRSASGYTVAHTAALTADGQLFRWMAADGEITISDAPLPDRATLEELTAEIAKFSGVDLETKCPNFPNEILLFQDAAISVRCPELSLAQPLLAAYQAAADLSAPLLADERNLPIPETVLPFDARLYYERRDGSTLTIFEDGTVSATYPITATDTSTATESATATAIPPETVTSSIPAGEIDPLIIPMLASDVIPRGVSISISTEQTEFDELLLLRGADGVYEFAWSDGVGQELLPGVQILDLLLDQIRPK